MSIPSIKLNNGTQIPQIGLGTWRNKNEQECRQAVLWALEAGYRHIDTAQIYGNEAYIGDALQEQGIARSGLFITTKIWNGHLFWHDIISSFEESLAKLQTNYVDLLLIHFPVTELRRPAWHKIEEIYESGRARSIGVSNYTVRHLEELLRECKIKPAVNQVELHVFLQQPELVEYCKTHDIAIEAYSPLAHGHGLDDPTLNDIAKKHGKSTAQIMLKWCLDQDFIILPKSTHQERIQQNIDLFDFQLDDDDHAKLKTLDRDLRTCWDPTHIP